MTPQLPFRLVTALLAAVLIFGGDRIPKAEAHGGGGHGGGGGHAGGHAGGHPGGYAGGHPGYAGGAYHHYGYGGYGYHGGYYGGYAPFGYGLGAGLLLGTGLGYGLGSGLYRPYYGYGYGGGGYGLGAGGVGYGAYPYPSAYGYGASGPAVVGPDGTPVPGVMPPPANRPAPDDAAHLELIVPQDAEVLFDGKKTSQQGRVRHFVSPPLTPNKVHTYEVVVRYTDASGKVVTDRRNIDVRANDWFNIDFTRPAPKTEEPPPAPPVP